MSLLIFIFQYLGS